MAALAPTYGATPKTLEAEFFPGVISDSRRAGDDMAWRKLRAVAADVAVVVRAAGLQPGAITAEGSPLAYDWLTRTILLGAAAEYGMAASSITTDVTEAWQRQFRDRLRQLTDSPRAVLQDVPGYSPHASAVSIFR